MSGTRPSGRHAGPLAAAGYEVTGVDRDIGAVARAARRVPEATFVVLDQRRVAALRGTFDAAMILWLLDPDHLAARAARRGFSLVEACCWWDDDRPPTRTSTATSSSWS